MPVNVLTRDTVKSFCRLMHVQLLIQLMMTLQDLKKKQVASFCFACSAGKL